LLKLSSAQRSSLKASGAINLSGIATALRLAPSIALHNAEVQRVRKLQYDSKLKAALPEPIAFSVSSKDGAAMLATIGSAVVSASTSTAKSARRRR
jgi:hypothetical protein